MDGVDKRKAYMTAYRAAWYQRNKERLDAKSLAWAKANRERSLAIKYAYRERNKEKVKAKVKEWQKANPERMRAASARFAKAHREQVRAMKNKWNRANPEKARARTAAWNLVNQERKKENGAKYRRENPAKMATFHAERRAYSARATPAWANRFLIREVYALARLRTKMLGYKWSVDHIVPLRSPLVCGLHVEHNLRVIPGLLNLKKGNRHWPDMP